MDSKFKISPKINSEFGKLKTVITHLPGKELEKVTPQNIKTSLYSDLLNLEIAKEEYSLFRKVLQKHCNTLEIKDLLSEALKNTNAKLTLINSLVFLNGIDNQLKSQLISKNNDELATLIIEGGEINNTHIAPAFNLFFTRDIAIIHNKKILIPQMASQVRAKEAEIAKTIFMYNPLFEASSDAIIDASTAKDQNIKFEGGDIHILTKDITIIGLSLRTNIEGINFIISQTSKNKKHTYIIQELPTELESYIHLDMVFSILSSNECLTYKPIIESPEYKAIVIEAEDSKVISTKEYDSLFQAFSSKGISMKPIYCGNNITPHDSREQWHSGANFFSLDNGKIIGYERNLHTLEALNNEGFEIIKAVEIEKYNLEKIKKYVITFPGNELVRGGGGARCMTMPIVRE